MRGYRMFSTFVFVVVVGMGAAVGAHLLTRREPAPAVPAAKAADTVPFTVIRPSGKQLKLTRTAKSLGGLFSVRAPASAKRLPPLGNERSLLALSLHDRNTLAMLVVLKNTGKEPDPVASLRADLLAKDPKARSLRRTRIAGEPAATADRVLKGDHRMRQFRFAHDGTMYSAIISYQAGDRVALDTGLAMLATWKWAA